MMANEGYRARLHGDILAIAKTRVAKDGLGSLQARRIAAEAKCSVGSLYNVFGDIDGLILAVNIATVAELGQALKANVDATRGQPSDARLVSLALAYMRFALDHLNSWKAVFEHRLPDHTEVPPGYRSDQARLLSLIETIIASEIADGRLRARAGRALFAAVHGNIALSVDNKLATFSEAELSEEITFIVRAAGNGLRAAR